MRSLASDWIQITNREVEALNIIDEWRRDGYSLRIILTEALLRFGKPSAATIDPDQVQELLKQLSLISQMLEQFDKSRSEKLYKNVDISTSSSSL